jgi:hypothetical protein
MAKGDLPISDMMTQNFEQTRKAMENCANFFEKTVKASPWLNADLHKKIQKYIEQNTVAANELIAKLSAVKDVQAFWNVQTEFMQAQWKAFAEQMKDLGETVTKDVTALSKDIAA